MEIDCHKMHVHGDDFLVLDLRDSSVEISEAMVKEWGCRITGIGFNQLAELSHDTTTKEARLKFWNSDGSRLNACGSATRGVAQILMQERSTERVMLTTPTSRIECSINIDGAINVGMGIPYTKWHEIPLTSAENTLFLPLDDKPAACSMGNPHCTYFVEDISLVDITERGSMIERNDMFKNGTNVHFVQVLSRNCIRLRIWERGSGIPLGSGSCCCGAVVNGIRRGILDTEVQVICDGGTSIVQWDGINEVRLSGHVSKVFSRKLKVY